MEAKHYLQGLALAAGLTIAVVSAGALAAQMPAQPAANTPPAGPAPRGGAPAGAPPAAPPAKPLVPVAASSVAARPEKYFGERVSIFGTVEQSVGPTAFTVDQDKTKVSEKAVLVVAPRLHEAVEPNAYITVIGEVVRADLAEIAKVNKLAAAGLTADLLNQHAGRAVIVASAVVTGALTDLARFIPPPMTPEEALLDKAMKAVGAANGALRKGVDAANAELVKTNTTILTKAFTETEAFWKARGKADAVKMAQEARRAAQSIETAAGMGNWNDAKTHNTTLGQQCASCHGVYRERGEDGSFFIKPGMK
ncbi:MAG TPA: hypothetical protein VNJ02_12625 [Vicinamibacterales bacterium]|nr:hypothetical protein [Vicinamibacterales bacterium]